MGGARLPGVHTCRQFVTSAAKAGSFPNLDCTAEAVLHPIYQAKTALSADRRRLPRQGEVKSGTVIQFTLHINGPGVGAHNMFGDGQAQAGAARFLRTRFVHPVEALKQPGSILRYPPLRRPAAAPGSCHSGDSAPILRSNSPVPVLVPLPGAVGPHHTRGPAAAHRSSLSSLPASPPALSARPKTGRN